MRCWRRLPVSRASCRRRKPRESWPSRRDMVRPDLGRHVRTRRGEAGMARFGEIRLGQAWLGMAGEAGLETRY
jgi:hypothetical protein